MLFSPLSAHLGPGMHCTSPGCRAGHASFIPEEAQLQVYEALLLLPCSGKRGCSGHTPWAGNKGGLGFGSQHNWGFTSMGEALITQVEVAECPPSSSHSALCFSARAQAPRGLGDCQLLEGEGHNPREGPGTKTWALDLRSAPNFANFSTEPWPSISPPCLSFLSSKVEMTK